MEDPRQSGRKERVVKAEPRRFFPVYDAFFYVTDSRVRKIVAFVS